MKRYASLFRIRPEMKDEYRKAHDEIWPDMAQAIRSSGIRNYSISFRPDGTLFAYFECEDAVKAMEYLKKTEVNTRWQNAMEKFFLKENRALLGPEMEDLEEVFHLD